ncbi:hypothetical protein CA265_04560 [Sphingobacteriaceae bacterium GW460-11-11-14-LB5]|nr:hypothetical protein CA265_04560 [Sphingobacteriaceae bacterium GW460-11-11-14-LB5]
MVFTHLFLISYPGIFFYGFGKYDKKIKSETSVILSKYDAKYADLMRCNLYVNVVSKTYSPIR